MIVRSEKEDSSQDDDDDDDDDDIDKDDKEKSPRLGTIELDFGYSTSFGGLILIAVLTEEEMQALLPSSSTAVDNA
jgi:hypothetical protein